MEEDLKRLDRKTRAHIFDTIEKKLSLDPYAYGEPLRKELFGYWKLKVGAYRVIYKIDKLKVIVRVVKIGSRRDSEVYREMMKRAKRY